MNLLALFLVLFGALGLCFSLKSAVKICQISSRIGWRVLLGLILFFILGYITFSAYLLQQSHANMLDVGISFILFFGAVFVIIINGMSQESLQELASIIEKERFNAHHDYLTRLENRQRCMAKIADLQSADMDFALMLIDLNNFKQMNDAIGHVFGDKVLIGLAERFTRALLPHNSIYRMGGDEFVIVIQGRQETDIYAQNNALLSELHAPLIVDELSVDIHYSAGTSAYDRQQPKDAVTLLKQADIAMYSAKRTKQSLVIFDAHFHKDSDDEFHLISRLKTALNGGELTVYYQPIVSAKSGEIHGVEALLRWPQKDGSVIMPESFIAIAENNNMIRQVSLFVISHVFQDLPQLLQAEPNLIVHVNLSSQDFIGKDLVNLLAAQVNHSQKSAQHVMFELTESMMMTDLDQANELVEILIEMGFSVSIDDFGTGFSSFSLLKELSIAQIKIDRSFIDDCINNEKDKVIVETAVFLAKRLGCSVVAEGVDSDSVIDYLITLECDYFQGFKISEALPLAACIKWIESSGMVKSALRKY
ncbi:bifunctional diguanylate cyclase/phosphodiesterase [Pseudoalteromonas sp. MMG013]|uniref:putative bifunctional diguanylate cyclase/phosphodiesterase n=1 Tax=Pseudoalteromonas sp. MMG013 TaxID=2822687 RepID=UPI001B37E41C|nr:bifunctional diguanylate cyclase/phosphodiesterase [Pseudoalteromonas sp. MMG013]